MGERVAHDVYDVLVTQRVGDLAALPYASYESSLPQHPKVLRNQWLAQAGQLDELVNNIAAGP